MPTHGTTHYACIHAMYVYLREPVALDNCAVIYRHSSVASRQAPNLKVAGSNPTPATKRGSQKRRPNGRLFLCPVVDKLHAAFQSGRPRTQSLTVVTLVSSLFSIVNDIYIAQASALPASGLVRPRRRNKNIWQLNDSKTEQDKRNKSYKNSLHRV